MLEPISDFEYIDEEEELPGVHERTKAGRLPTVVIAGRPNVGKSTLVNRIVGHREAIVEARPGVTRDRKELRSDWRGQSFIIIDTGGVIEKGDALDKKVTDQALRAVREADVVLFVVDTTTGITADDEAVSLLLRRSGARIELVANKVDGEVQEQMLWELMGLGYADPLPVSALHGRGVGDLLDVVVDRIEEVAKEREEKGESDEDRGSIFDQEVDASVALVGRPNVGKSTLFNRLVGDERSVVHDIPGTTRDAIDTIIETETGRLRLVDTAGLRRRSRIGEGSEYYSLVRSLAAIDLADVVLLLIDSTQSVTHQDQRLAERIDLSGSPVVIVLNKWELLETQERLDMARDVKDRLGFLDYAPVLRISAASGFGVHRLLPAVADAIEAYGHRIPTSVLNEAMKAIQAAHPPHGSRILYAVQGAVNPPTITLFASQRLAPTYLRYIEGALRERFTLGPTPLKLRVRLRGKK